MSASTGPTGTVPGPPPAPPATELAAGAPPGGSAALLEEAAEGLVAGTGDDGPGPARHRLVRRLLRQRLAVASLVFLVLLALAAVAGERLTGHPVDPPLTADVLAGARQGPSSDHWFGTDELGRDQLTRVLVGARVSLAVGLGTAVLAAGLGTFVGALAGWRGGWVDAVLMRLTDLVLVVPTVAVLMVLAEQVRGSVLGIVAVLGALSWMAMARIVRAEVRGLREREFVAAARASGATDRWIVLRHVLPNMTGVIVVFTTLEVALVILTESFLSFLGLGLQPPTVSWGTMIDQSQQFVGTDFAYLVWFPAGALFLTVLAVNFVGEGLRDALDPRAGR